MKLATNYPVIMPVQSAQPAAAPTSVPRSANVFPFKLPGGGELTADSARALGLGLNFPLPGTSAVGAPVPWSASPGASVACYVSPHLAARRSNNSKLIEGVKNVTSLIAGSLDPRIKLVHDTAWLGHDCLVFYRDLKDPEVSQGERLVSLGDLGSSTFGVLAGIFHTPWLDQTSTTLHFAGVIGDHLHTGKLTFSHSELLELSSAPDAEEYSKIVAVTEIVLP